MCLSTGSVDSLVRAASAATRSSAEGALPKAAMEAWRSASRMAVAFAQRSGTAKGVARSTIPQISGAAPGKTDESGRPAEVAALMSSSCWLSASCTSRPEARVKSVAPADQRSV